MNEFEPEFTCRYDVLGPPNGCHGDCEGTGLIPHFEQSAVSSPMAAWRNRRDDDPPIYRVLWYLMEATDPTDDGWHFVPCPTCQPDDRMVRLAYQLMGAAPDPPTEQP